MKTAIAVVFVSMLSYGQSAPVIHVSKDDAELARNAYNAATEAQAKWESIKGKLKDKYSEKKTVLNGDIAVDTRFACGIVFSSDFTVAVPDICPTHAAPCGFQNGAPMWIPASAASVNVESGQR